jgi:hypothetical protein
MGHLEPGGLENIVKSSDKMSVSYNFLPWFFYPTNWAANFPFKKIGRHAKNQVNHRYQAKVKYDGTKTGIIAEVPRGGELSGIHYRALYIDNPTLDHVIEWSQDSPREIELNERTGFFDKRRSALSISGSGQHTSLYRHEVPLSKSWLALPFYPIRALFAKDKETVELGTLDQIEGTGLPGNISLDQNLVKQIFTIGLGKYYDVRGEDGTVYAKVKRNPFIKLLTLGLKNHYTVKFSSGATDGLKMSMPGIVDYAQYAGSFKNRDPVPVENVTRFS